MSATTLRRYLLSACCVCLLCATRQAIATPVPRSLDEKIILVQPAGTDHEDHDIALWQNRVKASEASNQSIPGTFERLGWAYIAKARRTLDAGYYKLAEKTADVMDARFGPTDESLLLRGHVYHNLHRFQEAEAVARQLVARRGIAFDYALLSDSLMEQGKLAKSVTACQKMMELKPGVDAYSRAANLRWLTGDLPGAIQAMEAAVRAGSPLDATNTAWTLSRLSSYYLQAGKTQDALAAAATAERLVSDYPPALLAKGRAYLALGQLDLAIAPIEKAESLNPLPEYQWWLADALRADGKAAAAARIEGELQLKGEVADPRTFSLYLSTRGLHSDAALRMATAELSNRGDVFTQDALAWALDSKGDFTGANTAIKAALSAQTKDARLFFHAGEIARNLGNTESAKTFFEEAERFSGTLTPSEKALLDSRLKPKVDSPATQTS
jgi:tetratricopeptide (TPR) repeat protein